MVAPYTAPEAT